MSETKKPFILKLLYEPLLTVFGILYIPHLLKRLRQEPDKKRLLKERFGRYEFKRKERLLVWIHAVSVGEVQAAREFIQLFLGSFSDSEVVLSTTTPTGQAIAKTLEHKRLKVVYCPFDFPRAVKRAFDAIQPDCVVIMETEIWPNMIWEARTRNIPIGIMNGRISDRAVKRYRMIKSLIQSLLSKLTFCFVRSEKDKERFLELGVHPERLHMTGSMKFDQEVEFDIEAVHKLQSMWQLEDSRVLIGGSTHEGEESVLIRTFQMLLREFPGLKLIIAPRHIERSPKIIAEAEGAGFHPVLASKEAGKITDILVLDQMGVLTKYFALSDVIFMGGSLIRHGGQNPIEAARQKKPVLHGTFVSNFEDIYTELDELGGAFLVEGESALYQQAASLLSDSKNSERAGRIAFDVVEGLKGASRKNLELLKPHLSAQRIKG